MEILLARQAFVQMYTRGDDGHWTVGGNYSEEYCNGRVRVDPRVALKAGTLKPVAPLWPDLLVDGSPPIQIKGPDRCPS